MVRRFRILHRHRDRVALGRVDVEGEAKLARQNRAEAAQGQHIAIRPQCLVASLLQDLYPQDPIPGAVEAQHFGAVAKVDPGLLATFGQGLGKLAGIAGLVLGGVSRTGDPVPDRRQRRFDVHRPGGINDLPVTPQVLHDTGGLDCALEFLGVGVEVQDPLLQVIVLQTQFLAERLQLAAAVCAQVDHLANVVGGLAGRALPEKRQGPAPLCRIQARPEQQRRVRLEQPLHHLQRRRGVGPGFGVGHGNLTTVGVAGFKTGPVLPVHHRDLIPFLLQEPGRGYADHSRAQHHDVHACLQSIDATPAPGRVRTVRELIRLFLA